MSAYRVGDIEAINRITGFQGELLGYRLASVTGGADAQGEVFLRVRFPGGTCSGKAASTDIVGSSARAAAAASQQGSPVAAGD